MCTLYRSAIVMRQLVSHARLRSPAIAFWGQGKLRDLQTNREYLPGLFSSHSDQRRKREPWN